MTSAVYDRIGVGYATHRRPDPAIAARIEDALGDARTVVNVGAGTGSYEPADRGVIAVEPSRTMIDQRAHGAPPAVQGVAASLPFADGTFDAAMAIMTIHHWDDPGAGIAELHRVAARVVVLTFDVDVHNSHWLFDYLPEVAELTARVMPPLSLYGDAEIESVPVRHDCPDGMIVTMWRRPEAYLDPSVRAATSGLSLIDQDVVDAAMGKLAADLRSGAWARRYGHLLERETLDVGLRIVR